jgi:hypothetical protein
MRRGEIAVTVATSSPSGATNTGSRAPTSAVASRAASAS